MQTNCQKKNLFLIPSSLYKQIQRTTFYKFVKCLLLFEGVITDKIHARDATESSRPRWIVFQAFPVVFAKFTMIPKPWHCRHMCGGPDGYRQSPLHQDASIWPKTIDLTGTGSKTRNPVLLLRFLSLQFFINSQAGQCEGVPDTVKYTDTETPKQNREIVSSCCATVTAQSFFGVSSPNKPNQLPAASLNSSPCSAAVCTQNPI